MPSNWREAHKLELVDFVKNFYQKSWNWRNAAFHRRWDKWERNYRNIYDPEILARKEPWQAAMFVPATVTNVEVISASLTKIGSGKKRPIALEPRESGDELQAELNTDLMDYYREKGDYEMARYHAIKEACIFGSGFIKLYWEKKYAKRRIVRPQMEKMMSAIMNMRWPKQVGQTANFQDVLVKNGVTFNHIHLRNIFPEPNFTSLSRLIHRDRLTYSELVRMADGGHFDADSVEALREVEESDNFEVDMRTVLSERGLTDPKLPRAGWDKKHTVWEYNGYLPLKWIDLEMPEDTEAQQKAAMEVVPATALTASGDYYLASGESANYDDEPSFLKVDYIPSPGGGYGIGVAQLIEGLQEEYNEIRNQRIDNVSLIMNRMIAVLEKHMIDPKEIRSAPGAIWRFKGAELDDVRKAFAEVPLSDVPLSAFRETGELERQIQETTAANRVTTGTAGLSNDTNQTLGGMELLKQAAFDRFVVYAFIIGRQLDVKVARKISELIYLNIDDDSVMRILGQIPIEMMPDQWIPRYQAWKRQEPEDLNVCYDFVPVDVFTMENRFQKSQDLISKLQLMASIMPGFNFSPAIKRLFKYSDFSSDEIADILSGIPNGPMPTPMSQGMGVAPGAKPVQQSVGETPPLPTPQMAGNGASPIG